MKHWPSRLDGLIECARALVPGGVLVIVEIDGGQHEDDLLRFASHTRIPPGLRRLYPGFARRSFVPVSPTAEELAAECASAGCRSSSSREAADDLRWPPRSPDENVYSSACTGYEKPHRRSIGLALEYFEVDGAWMIGNRAKSDLGAANAVGIPSVLVVRDRPAPLIETATLVLSSS